MKSFEHRVLRMELINTAVKRCASRSTEFDRDKKTLNRELGRDVKILSDKILRMKVLLNIPVVHV